MDFELDLSYSKGSEIINSGSILTIVNSQPLENTPFIAPYVPIAPAVCKKAIALAEIQPHDVLLDLGCGDGRILTIALDSDTPPSRAIGVEYDFLLCAHVLKQQPRFEIIQADMFKVNIIDLKATVMILYLLEAGLGKLKPVLIQWFADLDGAKRILTVGYPIPGIKEKHYGLELCDDGFMGGDVVEKQKIFYYDRLGEFHAKPHGFVARKKGKKRNFLHIIKFWIRANILVSARSKILKPVGVNPDELELQVAQNILDLEHNAKELKADLRGLQFTAAKEIEIGHGRKAIIIFVPVPLLKPFHKVQVKLVRELEKKFSDRHVLLVGQRRILGKPSHKTRVLQKRPRSRTLTQVHENLLSDLVFPTEIVGKRTKVKVDGSKTIKVLLDRKDHTSLEYKLDTFSATYKKLTGKDVVFEFPAQTAQE